MKSKYLQGGACLIVGERAITPIIGTYDLHAHGHPLSSLDKIGPITNATKKPTA